MGMRALPAAAATSWEDGVRGTNHPTKAAAREGQSEEEQEDKLSPLPSWTSPHKTSTQVWASAPVESLSYVLVALKDTSISCHGKRDPNQLFLSGHSSA